MRLKEPLCGWINLSRGLSYGPVTLFIILSLSDEKKCDITSTLPCFSQKAPLKSMRVYVCVCVCGRVGVHRSKYQVNAVPSHPECYHLEENYLPNSE